MSSKFQNRPWIGRFAALFGQQRQSRPLPRSRQLLGESLEPRCVLTALPADEMAPSLSAYVAQPHEPGPVPAESSIILESDAQAVPAIDLSFVPEFAVGDSCGGFAGDPTATLAGDAPEGESDSGPSSGTGGGGEENQPPNIATLSIVIDEGFLVIRGSVSDESPETCIVSLTGLITETTTVDELGNFEFRLVSLQLFGALRFVARDDYGLQSPVWTEWLDPS